MQKVIAKNKEHLQELINNAFKKERRDLNYIDTSAITDMSHLFVDRNQYYNISKWDVSNVTDMSFMFCKNSIFNLNISSWNVSNVTNMSCMFQGALNFNQDINGWDVSKVTDMENMFLESNFNQDINGWDVSNVTNMAGMFYNTTYNHPLNNWDVSNVNDMSYMFYNTIYNHPLNSWDVSNVNDMSYMFYNTTYNHPLDSWDVSNVLDIKSMFELAHNFKQDISSWYIDTNIEFMKGMFGKTEFDLKYAPKMIYKLAGVPEKKPNISPSLADLIHSLELTNIEIALNMAYGLNLLEDTKKYLYRYLFDANLLGKIEAPCEYKKNIDTIIKIL